MNIVRLILTGGTIDSAEPYRSDIKSTFPSGTHIPEMLEQARVKNGVIVDVLMLKDSNDMTEEDRQLLLERCREMPRSAPLSRTALTPWRIRRDFSGSG